MSNDRYAVIPLYKDQSPPSNAIMWGNLTPVTEFLRINEVRNSALAAVSRAGDAREELAEREQDLKTRQLQLLNTALDTLAQRMDAFEERLQARQDAEEAAEARRIEDEIARLPDPDAPAATERPAHGHFNTGDLSPMPPTVDESDEGAMPASITRGAPGNGPLEDPEELAYPETPRQRAPVAVSLGEDDDEDMTLGGSPPAGRVGY